MALTVKTRTGVNHSQEEKNYGPWFPTLFALVKTQDSYQPERAVEPTNGSSEDVNEESRAIPTIKFKIYTVGVCFGKSQRTSVSTTIPFSVTWNK